MPEYKGMFDVLIKTSRNEGIPALWKGFTPYFARTGPQEWVFLLNQQCWLSSFQGNLVLDKNSTLIKTVVTLMLMDAFMANYRRLSRE